MDNSAASRDAAQVQRVRQGKTFIRTRLDVVGSSAPICCPGAAVAAWPRVVTADLGALVQLDA